MKPPTKYNPDKYLRYQRWLAARKSRRHRHRHPKIQNPNHDH